MVTYISLFVILISNGVAQLTYGPSNTYTNLIYSILSKYSLDFSSIQLW